MHPGGKTIWVEEEKEACSQKSTLEVMQMAVLKNEQNQAGGKVVWASLFYHFHLLIAILWGKPWPENSKSNGKCSSSC